MSGLQHRTEERDETSACVDARSAERVVARLVQAGVQQPMKSQARPRGVTLAPHPDAGERIGALRKYRKHRKSKNPQKTAIEMDAARSTQKIIEIIENAPAERHDR